MISYFIFIVIFGGNKPSFITLIFLFCFGVVKSYISSLRFGNADSLQKNVCSGDSWRMLSNFAQPHPPQNLTISSANFVISGN